MTHGRLHDVRRAARRVAPALALVGCAALAARFAPAHATDGAQRRSYPFVGRTMGTYDQVVIVTADSAAAAPIAEACQHEFARLDSVLTNWTTTSEVARLNRTAGTRTTHVQADVARVIAAAMRTWRESDGAYDITVEPLVRLWGFLAGTPHVPPRSDIRAAYAHVGAQRVKFDSTASTLRFTQPWVKIDLGGLGKGYAADVATGILRERGVSDALVDLSGKMYALGHPADADAWRIGIRDPRDRIPYFARLTLRDEGIATSGKYEQFVDADGKRYGHIMDPRTGWPAQGLISVTVVTPDAITADAWATALFVLGPRDARRKALERGNVSAVLVVPGAQVDTVFVERSLEDRFVLEDAARTLFHVEYF
ncbi:MAG TPA: FAD:protein FMN transferase [Candidatus Saccharimonadaceae bacterium]|nr:FAD:protein FMN transferase [Candidatus Saccharimonadaceae bacterium]